MEFEYDPNKSKINLEKHKIDFVEAQILWQDENILEIPVQTKDEKRYLLIGKIKTKFWSAVITYRQQKIRLISVRRSRKEEVNLYENK